MEKRDGATIRRDRIRRIIKLITGANVLPQDIDYIIALIQLQEGLTKPKIIDILEIIETLGFIKIDWKTGWITLNEDKNIDNGNSKNDQ